jgi:hypothetical protein
MGKVTIKGLNFQSDNRQGSIKRITKQSQGRLAKKFIPFSHPSFGDQPRRLLFLQLLLQPAEFLLQGVDLLASSGGYFVCAFQLQGRGVNFPLQPNLVRFQRSKLGGEGLQGRYNASQILKERGK